MLVVVCGLTALQAASGGGHLEVVERLLAAGADVNAAAAFDGGPTALQAASEGGYLDVVERLLAAGADANAAAAGSGLTALQAASGAVTSRSWRGCSSPAPTSMPLLLLVV